MMISEIKMETLKLKKTCYDLTNLLILLLILPIYTTIL